MSQGKQVFKATGPIWEKNQSWVDNKVKRTLRYHGWQSNYIKKHKEKTNNCSFIWALGPSEKFWGKNIGVWLYNKTLWPPRPHCLLWISLSFTAMVATPENRKTFISSVIKFLHQYGFDGLVTIGSTLALVEAHLRTSISSLSWCRWGGRWHRWAQENSKRNLCKESLVFQNEVNWSFNLWIFASQRFLDIILYSTAFDNNITCVMFKAQFYKLF